MKNSNPKRVLLAIDLKAKEPSLVKRIWKGLHAVTKGEGCIIEPVTILDRADIALGQILKDKQGDLRTFTEEKLTSHLAKLGLKGLEPATVLFTDGSSTQRAVLRLMDYASETKADLIAISSHARQGLKRFFLGSFAEGLALQSETPLLVVNASQKALPSTVKTVLFPTDFSAPSRTCLNELVKTLGAAKPKIVLYHIHSLPPQFYFEPLSAYSLPQTVIEQQRRKNKGVGETWVQELKSEGIKSELIFDEKSVFVAEGILKTAKKIKADLVAMVSLTGKTEASLLGSVTRQVLRESPVSVWVVHPR